VDGKVVKRCGDTSDSPNYEETTDFCAAGDIITPHCDNREIYNPKQRFCSYVANKTYAPTSSVCDPTSADYDAASLTCKQFISVPLAFCGTGTAAENKYNAASWKWEYCVPKKNPTGGTTNPVTYSVFRCGSLQIPDLSIAGSEVCKCLGFTGTTNSQNHISPITNGCQCSTDYEYKAYDTKSYGASPNIVYDFKHVLGDGLLYTTGNDDDDLALVPDSDDDHPWIYAQATGVSNNVFLGSSATDVKVLYVPYGGQCIASPTCTGGAGHSQDVTRCKDRNTCVGANSAGGDKGYWDALVNKCVASEADCTTGEASNNECTTTASNACTSIAKCTVAAQCVRLGGTWDQYALPSPKCVTTASFCYKKNGAVEGYCRPKCGNGSVDGEGYNGCTNKADCNVIASGLWDYGVVYNNCVATKYQCSIGYASSTDACAIGAACTASTPALPDGSACAGSAATCTSTWGGAINSANKCVCTVAPYTTIGTTTCVVVASNDVTTKCGPGKLFAKTSATAAVCVNAGSTASGDCTHSDADNTTTEDLTTGECKCKVDGQFWNATSKKCQ